jgi:Homocysteine/selenocysteine methylase (S-methylmethionine-dependent)
MSSTQSLYRDQLPQLDGQLLVCDGGMETTMIYHEGLELPCFASFTLLDSTSGTEVLKKYYSRYAEIARRHRTGIIIETATWRANPDWLAQLGYAAEDLQKINQRAITLLTELRDEWSAEIQPVVIGGVIGPRGDGYVPGRLMSAAEAAAYHSAQMRVFAASAADIVTAYTMNYVEEAIGIVMTARDVGMPVAISFTVETDGRLPSGQTLRSAIEQVDTATDCYASYFQINCAHPTHFHHVLADDGQWLERIRGLRANASKKSHAELDASTTLDAGDPQELGESYQKMMKNLRNLSLIGGCCGTDHRHIAAMCRAVMA